MSVVDDFQEKFAVAWPPERWSELTVLAAVSGGADSVALLRAMYAVRFPGPGRIVVAHFNHGLRGEAADADQQFTADLCRRLNLPLEVGRGEPGELTRSGRDGIEAAARWVRLEFLQAAARRVGARYAATAHTADDQAETILHRVVRGTGLSGLAGIPAVRPLGDAVTLIRPMLGIGRAEVVEYLAALDQPYRHDATNDDPHFTRNRIRNDLLPRLAQEYNARVVDALLHLGRLAGEARTLVEGMADELLVGCVASRDGEPIRIDCRPFANQPRLLVRQAFIRLWTRRGWPQQSMGFDQWDLLAELALAAPVPARPTRILPGNIRAERQGMQLVLSRDV